MTILFKVLHDFLKQIVAVQRNICIENHDRFKITALSQLKKDIFQYFCFTFEDTQKNKKNNPFHSLCLC